MVALTHLTGRSRVVPGFGLALGILLVLTAVRLIGLRFSTADLFFDESQYWAWSRELAFGYYSKPPLLAWVIAAAERVCGSTEACIRSPAPIFYCATSLVVYAVAQYLYDSRIAFFAALSIGLATGAVFSARIISTDVPLLFFWAVALLAYVKLLNEGGTRWTILLGVSLGLGLMAKYAMIYFILGAAAAAWLDADARRLLRTPAPWIALLIAAAIITPNIVWNLQHGLATFKHTGDNIQGSGVEFDPGKGFEFFASQFAVFGPIIFAVLLAIIFRVPGFETNRTDRLMLAFTVPPLALVTALGFVTRALANWAAPAFVSAMIVVVAIMVRRGQWKWIMVSLGLGVVTQIALIAGDAMATRLHVPFLANGDVYHRTLGGHALGQRTGELARRVGARTIVGETRDDEASLVYYWRDQPEKVLAWRRGPVPDHQFEITRALTDAAPEPLLFVSMCPASGRFNAQFANVEPLGTLEVPTGPTSKRIYYAFKLSGRRGPLQPLGGCG
jgi:4-amino-4-deoxy-L-arabinose transferase-like glycosyltransferase